MTKVVAVAKIGKDVFESTDPNDFVFHSSYNTFKIILEGIKSVSLSASTNNQTFTQSHGLGYIPLVTAFAKESGQSRVFLPNMEDVSFVSPAGARSKTGVKFNYIASSNSNIIFNFDNTNISSKSISIKYFVLERI